MLLLDLTLELSGIVVHDLVSVVRIAQAWQFQGIWLIKFRGHTIVYLDEHILELAIFWTNDMIADIPSDTLIA